MGQLVDLPIQWRELAGSHLFFPGALEFCRRAVAQPLGGNFRGQIPHPFSDHLRGDLQALVAPDQEMHVGMSRVVVVDGRPFDFVRHLRQVGRQARHVVAGVLPHLQTVPVLGCQDDLEEAGVPRHLPFVQALPKRNFLATGIEALALFILFLGTFPFQVTAVGRPLALFTVGGIVDLDHGPARRPRIWHPAGPGLEGPSSGQRAQDGEYLGARHRLGQSPPFSHHPTQGLGGLGSPVPFLLFDRASTDKRLAGNGGIGSLLAHRSPPKVASR